MMVPQDRAGSWGGRGSCSAVGVSGPEDGRQRAGRACEAQLGAAESAMIQETGGPGASKRRSQVPLRPPEPRCKEFRAVPGRRPASRNCIRHPEGVPRPEAVA